MKLAKKLKVRSLQNKENKKFGNIQKFYGKKRPKENKNVRA